MSRLKVVMLAGPKHVGKSTTANALLKHCKEHSRRVSLIENGRKMLAAIGINNPGDEKKEDPIFRDKSYRDLLKSLGTAWGRDMVDEDIWAILLARDIVMEASQINGHATFVVDDLRIDNEVSVLKEYLPEAEVTVIELAREGIEYEGDHITEEGISDELVDETVNLTTLVPAEAAEIIADRCSLLSEDDEEDEDKTPATQPVASPWRSKTPYSNDTDDDDES